MILTATILRSMAIVNLQSNDLSIIQGAGRHLHYPPQHRNKNGPSRSRAIACPQTMRKSRGLVTQTTGLSVSVFSHHGRMRQGRSGTTEVAEPIQVYVGSTDEKTGGLFDTSIGLG